MNINNQHNQQYNYNNHTNNMNTTFYNTKSNIFKRNLQRVAETERKLPILNLTPEKDFDVNDDNKLMLTNNQISEIIQSLKLNSSTKTHNNNNVVHIIPTNRINDQHKNAMIHLHSNDNTSANSILNQKILDDSKRSQTDRQLYQRLHDSRITNKMPAVNASKPNTEDHLKILSRNSRYSTDKITMAMLNRNNRRSLEKVDTVMVCNNITQTSRFIYNRDSLPNTTNCSNLPSKSSSAANTPVKERILSKINENKRIKRGYTHLGEYKETMRCLANAESTSSLIQANNLNSNLISLEYTNIGSSSGCGGGSSSTRNGNIELKEFPSRFQAITEEQSTLLYDTKSKILNEEPIGINDQNIKISNNKKNQIKRPDGNSNVVQQISFTPASSVPAKNILIIPNPLKQSHASPGEGVSIGTGPSSSTLSGNQRIKTTENNNSNYTGRRYSNTNIGSNIDDIMSIDKRYNNYNIHASTNTNTFTYSSINFNKTNTNLSTNTITNPNNTQEKATLPNEYNQFICGLTLYDTIPTFIPNKSNLISNNESDMYNIEKILSPTNYTTANNNDHATCINNNINPHINSKMNNVHSNANSSVNMHGNPHTNSKEHTHPNSHMNPNANPHANAHLNLHANNTHANNHLNSSTNTHTNIHTNIHLNSTYNNINANTNTTNGSNLMDKLTCKLSKSKEKKHSNINKANLLEDIHNNADFINLKKDIPSLMSYVQASRQDILLLSKWLDNKIQSILDNTQLSNKDKANKCDEVYNICLNEIIRQITMDCYERGAILTKIWCSYLEFFNIFKEQFDEEIKKIQVESQISYNRVHKMYKDILQERDKNIENLNKEINKFNQEILNKEKKYNDIVLDNKKLMQKIEYYKQLIKKYKVNVQYLVKENNAYKSRNSGLIPNNLNIEQEQRELQPKPQSQLQQFKGMLNPIKTGNLKNMRNVKKNSDKVNNNEKDPTLINDQSFQKEHELENFDRSNKKKHSILDLSIIKSQNPHSKEEDLINASGCDNDNNNIKDNGRYDLEINLKPNINTLSSSRQSSSSSGNSFTSSFDIIVNESNDKEEIIKIEQLNLLSNRIGDINKRFVDNNTQTAKGELIDDKECQTNLILLNEKYDMIMANIDILDEVVIEYQLKQELDLVNQAKLKFLKTSVGNNKDHTEGKDTKDIKNSKNTKEIKNSRDNSISKDDKLKNHYNAISIHNEQNKSSKSNNQRIVKLDKIFRCHSADLNENLPNESLQILKEEYQKIMSMRLEEGLQKVLIEFRSKKVNKNSQGDNQIKFKTEKNQGDHILTAIDSSASKMNTNGVSTRHDTNNKEKLMILNENDMNNESLPIIDINENSMSSTSEKETSIEKAKKTLNKRNSILLLPTNSMNTPQPSSSSSSLSSCMNSHNLLNIDPTKIKDAYYKSIRIAFKSSTSYILPSTNNSIQQQQSDEYKVKDMQKIKIFMNNNDHVKSKLLNMVLNSKDIADYKLNLLRIIRIYKIELERNVYLTDIIKELYEYILYMKNDIHRSLIKNVMHDKNIPPNTIITTTGGSGGIDINQHEQVYLYNQQHSQLNQYCPLNQHCQCNRYDQYSQFNKHDQHNHKSHEPNQHILEIDEEFLKMPKINDDDIQEILSDNDIDCIADIKHPNGSSNNDITTPKKKGNFSNVEETPRYNSSNTKLQSSEKRNNQALLIIQKLKSTKFGKFKNFMSIKQVLKLITQIYEERMIQSRDNTLIKDEPLSCFVYDLFLNNFNFGYLARQMYIVLILSIKRYLHIIRINLFARFLGLLDDKSNYTLDDLNKCIEMFEFIKNNTLGTNIINNDTDIKHYIPFLRILEYIKIFSENRLSYEEYQEFKLEFENIKENDPKNINRYGQIDIDLCALKILNKYRLIYNRTKQYVINAFKAADLDGNKTCSLKEFVLLYKYIESEKYDYNFVESIFEEEYDINSEDPNERALTFNKFTVVCVEYHLFSDHQQNLFLKIQSKDEIKVKFDELKKNWLSLYNHAVNLLKHLNQASNDDIEYWLNILNALDERIKNENDHKPFLIAYNIMMEEINELKNAEQNQEEVVYQVGHIDIITVKP